MTCSINIVRKIDPESECKYVDIDEELRKSLRCIIQHIADHECKYIGDEDEIDVKFLITNLYEKVGELKRRIEVLENGR